MSNTQFPSSCSRIFEVWRDGSCKPKVIKLASCGTMNQYMKARASCAPRALQMFVCLHSFYKASFYLIFFYFSPLDSVSCPLYAYEVCVPD